MNGSALDILKVDSLIWWPLPTDPTTLKAEVGGFYEFKN